MSSLISVLVVALLALILACAGLCVYYVHVCVCKLRELSEKSDAQAYVSHEREEQDVPFRGEDGLYAPEYEKKPKGKGEWI